MLVEHETELEHPRQEEQEDGQDQRELDQALAFLAALGSSPTELPEAAHRTGSMRMLLARSKLRLGPLNRVRIGVLYWWL